MSEIKLWDHQKRAVEKARGQKGFALFFEMGTGKTATTIHIVRDIYNEQKRLLRTLVLCPPIVIRNWKKEFQMHSKVKPQNVVCLTGKGIKRLEKIKKTGFHEGKGLGRIYIMNYEGLVVFEDLFHMIKVWDPEIIICDESHKLKNPSSKRSKKTRELADNAFYRYLLTGTPILKSPLDLYAQYRVLDGGKTFGTNFYAFRNTYFYDKNAGMPSQKYFPNWVVREDALEKIKKKMEPTGMSVKKSECLDLPPLVRQIVHVELGKDQKKAYEEMKKNFITFVSDKACTATLAMTKALRLQQILSGHLPVGDTEETKEIILFKENPRAEALAELLEDLTPDHKVIVWAVFREDFKVIKKVCEDLKLKYVEVHGGVVDTAKFRNVDQFNNDGDTRVFIGHPGSGGIGINLTSASYSIFYSRNFSLEQDLQAEARNYRGGSEVHEKITRIDLVAAGTIDEMILQRLKDKQSFGELILKQMGEELKNGSETDDN